MFAPVKYLQKTPAMKLQGRLTRTIWIDPSDEGLLHTFDQRQMPWAVVTEDLRSPEDCARAIRDMLVRGAPLIGATAAYGLYLAALHAPVQTSAYLDEAQAMLAATRPTAVDLFNALREVRAAMDYAETWAEKVASGRAAADALADRSAEQCRLIGQHGLGLIQALHAHKQDTIQVLTHCNAGWLACVDYGTALAPVYAAHDAGLPVHVWVDETRPRNQGARLTAFELLEHGVPHTLITDNMGGHLMQHGQVDMVITGTDRTTRQGDVANKIGTYLKALAAADNGVPFYVALPSTTLDLSITDGVRDIPIEARSPDEVRYVQGRSHDGSITDVLIAPTDSPALNYGFDVTPARLVTALITERGICPASEAGILGLFPAGAG